MISIESVSKRYGGLIAVNDVSCSIEKGEVFALLGPNGAGKTTLVRMLMGFSRPSAGEIEIDGIPAHDPACRKRVGYLAEQHRIPPYLSGLEYLNRHAALCGLSRAEAKRAVAEVLEKVGMSGKERQKTGTCSKGMNQRLGLAAALLGNPKLLILDEPGSGLDPLGMRDVRVVLENLRSEGLTIFLNSHLLSEMERVCSTAAIMVQGKIVVQGGIDVIVGEGESLEDVFVRSVEGSHV
jgi:ABC-2 type transport system ATP-binding protein